MNSAWKDLAEEAGFIRFKPDEDPWTPIDWSCDYTLELEVYSKLLIQKCIDICMKNQFSGADHFNNGSVSSAELIKQHFGIDK